MSDSSFGLPVESGSCAAAMRPVASVMTAQPTSGFESEIDFFTRRALEESHAAKRAANPEAAARHRYLAAAYSAELNRELTTAKDLESLILEIP